MVQAFIAATPPGRPVRILELGGGTGATTSSILPALPTTGVQYYFTDVSDFFLARAERLFEGFPFVSYGLLDLETDPRQQGFAAGQYDIVVAANVLHATRDLGQTIDFVRSLLAPDGLLALYEVTEPPSYFDTTVALIEGWQIYHDGLREDGPLLNSPRWLEVLQTRGFVNAHAFPAPTSPAKVIGSHVFVARTPGGARVPYISDPDPAKSRGHKNGYQPGEGEYGVLKRLAETPPSEHEEVLVEFVRRHVARGLRRDAAGTIDRDRRLVDLGLDSLMAIELRDRLSKELQLDWTLPATLIFDYPSVAAIASYLRARLGEADSTVETAADKTVAPRPGPTVRIGAAGVERLSDAEVEELLLKKLETLKDPL